MPLVDIYYSSVAGWQMLRERRSHPAFNKSHFAFVELSTKAILLSTELSMKVILLSESSWRDCFRRTYFFTIFSATIEMVNLNFFNKFAPYVLVSVLAGVLSPVLSRVLSRKEMQMHLV